MPTPIVPKSCCCIVWGLLELLNRLVFPPKRGTIEFPNKELWPVCYIGFFLFSSSTFLNNEEVGNKLPKEFSLFTVLKREFLGFFS